MWCASSWRGTISKIGNSSGHENRDGFAVTPKLLTKSKSRPRSYLAV